MDPQKMREMLAGIWERHRPDMEERLAVLEHTCNTLNDRELSAEERTGAVYAAHKLAGALGTFGRSQGSEVARSFERRLESENVLRPHLQELQELLQELRKIVLSQS